MTRQEEKRESRIDRLSSAVAEINKIAEKSEFPVVCKGEQYVDFKVGRMERSHKNFDTPQDAITELRLLVDFRGEYYSAFPIGGQFITNKIDRYFRRRIFMNPKDAYDFASKEVKEINQWYKRFD